ncbi:MAG: hypothetical protein MJZ54_04190 [Bacteroidaceae bacterium]|nr:hypothetical protein [Bacteroidaceae bacterium]
MIKLSEAEVAALENLIANKGNITFNYTIGGHEWRSQTKLFEDLSEVTAPEQEFVTIVSTSDLTDLHDGDVVTVECEENLPFLVTTDEDAPIYGIIHGHSNQDRYIYVDDSGNGKDTGSAGDPENVNDNYLWYITGNLIDGFRLHNKAFGGETLKGTETIATINGTASDIWELRGATHGSKFKEQDVFSLYQENVEYLNSHVNLNYWSTNDEGSSFYFEPQPIGLVDGTEYTNGTSTKVGLLTYTRNFKNTNWQALYIPFSLDYEEWCDDFDIARVYNFIDYDDNDDGVFDRTYLVVQKKTSGSTEPNYPYLIRAKETGNKTLTLTDKTLEPAESNSIDCSSVDYIYTFTGSYTPVTDMYANGYYALSGGALNKANSASVVLGAQRWYMELTARGGCYTTRAQSIKIVVDGEDETEAIIAPSSSPKGESPVAYDLMGRGVKGAVKGISIVNGKKIIN